MKIINYLSHNNKKIGNKMNRNNVIIQKYNIRTTLYHCTTSKKGNIQKINIEKNNCKNLIKIQKNYYNYTLLRQPCTTVPPQKKKYLQNSNITHKLIN